MHTSLRRLLLIAALGSSSAALAETAAGPFVHPDRVQIEDYFPPVDPELGYDQNVPRPESVLGHTIGSRYARPDTVIAWFEALAAASPKVKIVDMGRTHEGQRQITVLISSIRNLERLDELQRAWLAGERDAPLFAWHGYGVHGDEAGGVQAAVAVAWYLASSPEDDVLKLLRNVVVMIDPMQNPDGYGRYATWANQTLGHAPSADPASLERRPPWPGGRTNHYLLDLDRDWLLMQQPETMNRVRLLQAYRPVVMVDHHDGSSDQALVLQPGDGERWHPLIAESNRALTERLAAFQARALDRADRPYYARPESEGFYPGKGAIWADLQGSVGMRFEQAAGMGLVEETPVGRLTLPMTVHAHVLATLATLDGVVELDKELRAYREDYAERKQVPRGLPLAWIFDDGGDPSRAAALVQVLKDQRLSVFGIAEPVRTEGGEFLPGRAWVVPVLGAQAPLAHTLFADAPSTVDAAHYEISAWSLPHAFGVRAAALTRVPGKLAADSHVNRNYGVSGRTSAVAWVLPWDDYYAPAVLARLQAAGVKARLSTVPFESVSAGQAVSFKPGAVVIHRADVPEATEWSRDLLTRIVAGDAPLVGLDSSLSETGPDVGSPTLLPLSAASVALLAGTGTNAQEVGSIWHALDRRLGIPVTLLAADVIDADVLGRHTHLFVADGDYAGLPETAVLEIGRWVEAGGVLIVSGRAVTWTQAQYWLPDPGSPGSAVERYPYAEMASRDSAQRVGGAIVDVTLDRTHPLTFGIASDHIGLMKRGRVALKAPFGNPFTVVGAYGAKPLLSGYLPEDYTRHIVDSPAILAVPRGAGVIIAFADMPAFRSAWWVGERLLSNAVSFGSVIRPPAGRYGGSDAAP
ncbi:MAG: M14 family zinc carboxypeptidase [Pseudomonadales bacterium]